MEVWHLRVVVQVRDVERAVQFYRDTLGLRLAERWEHPTTPGAIFDTGHGQIQVYAALDGAASPIAAPTIVLVIADADREYVRLLSQGVRPLWGPATSAWGTRQFAIQDPDGTTIVFCAPAAPLPVPATGEAPVAPTRERSA
jgi:catechol 2,3-dioxygenase-like lactoylglutathione lyase family enzyme